MSEHSVTIQNGYIAGYGKSYFAVCACGWWGDSQFHEFAAVDDGHRHKDLQEQFVAAEAWGAV